MSPSNEPTGHNEPAWWGPLIDVLAGQRRGGCEIRTPEGLPPTRFPTMHTSVHQWPPPSATCPNTIGVAAGEQWRIGVNETRTETSGLRRCRLGGAVAQCTLSDDALTSSAAGRSSAHSRSARP